jgi:hypothetical protein
VCPICYGVPTAELDNFLQRTVGHIGNRGWSVVGVSADEQCPGWSYTIGLWHSYRHPELAMFGLQSDGMGIWLNTIGDRVQGGETLAAEQLVSGVIEGFDVAIGQVDPTWNDELFGTAFRFYRPPVPFLQVVWPDRNGLWPSDPAATLSCRTNQPQLHLPFDAHPQGPWTFKTDGECNCGCEVGKENWPFEHDGPDTAVYTTKTLTNDGGTIVGVVHDADGHWHYFDSFNATNDDMTVVHLAHLEARFSTVSDFALLPKGRSAWLQENGEWDFFDLADRG